MRILLIGKNGQLGHLLQTRLRVFGEVVAAGRTELDLSLPQDIVHTVRNIHPELIVNAAAYTAVDLAEQEAEQAMAVNGVAPGILAVEAQRLGIPIIHFSTDYVFDGRKECGSYVEEDPQGPLNVYGKTKLAGEVAVRGAGVPHLIFRTGWVYGLQGKNFLRTMLKLAREKREIRVVNDQFGAPTSVAAISEVVVQVIAGLMATGGLFHAFKEVSGVYHLTCKGETSWHGFAQKILNIACINNPPRLVAIPTSEYPTPAVRPRYSVLSNAKVEEAFAVVLPHWEEALQRCLDDHSPEPLAERRG
jgi:dTDP-4-dehydrorhamnose reductase